MADTHQQIRLASRPEGRPVSDNWQYSEQATLPQPEDGQVLVKVQYISIDPAMRGWMNAGRSYIEPVGIGEVMRALTAGTVVASRHPDFKEGDTVTGRQGVQSYGLSDGSDLHKVDTSKAPLPKYLSALGMTGCTAYFGLLDIGQPEQGQTVLVSAASGAVGSVVGQIAKIKGCRVVGIAGGEEKCRYLTDELGFDAVIDYKAESVAEAIPQACPDGIDVYFDNVGGEILDAALANLARQARVVICGAISQYNATERAGPANYMMLLVQHARMEGFVIFDYRDRIGEAVKDLGQWLAEGRLQTREDIVEGGIADFPDTLLKLFDGDNFGKLILKVD